MRGVAARRRRFEAELGGDFRNALERYRASFATIRNSLPEAIAQPSGRPFWYRCPLWLKRKYPRNRALTSAFVADATWAQYCLFFAVRMQDDLLDKQAGEPALSFLAAQYFAEAERRLLLHFPPSARFWHYYHEMLDRTARGILRIGELHRAGSTSSARLRRASEDVNALFGVGAAAVCCRAGHMEILPALRRIGGVIAFAGQVADDIMDLEEDFADGKLNYVARILLPSGRRTPGTGAAAVIRESLLRSDRYFRLLSRMQRELANAQREIMRLGLPGAARYAGSCLRMYDALESSYARTRLFVLFRGIQSASRR